MHPLQSPEARAPFSEAERRAIREQLERMLANPLFSHSKRYPTLLRYVVERTLTGTLADLKERTLGTEVFGRPANYDTNADPIVRVTAGEIRKRIAQYYHEHGHEGEIRIDLAPGSYVPEFDLAASAASMAGVGLSSPAELAAPAAPAPVWRHNGIRVAAVAGTVALLVAIAWLKPWAPQNALDRFWAPVLDSSSTVLLCVGQRQFLGSSPEPGQQANGDLPNAGGKSPVSLFKLYYLGSQNVAFPDVQTIGRLTGLLHAKGKRYRMQGESFTSFAELRDVPVVLVGAFDNDWTMRLMGPLRFSFERDNNVFWVRDRQNPTKKDRAVNYSTPYLDVIEDYALISRVLDPITERMVVVAGGLTGYGTMAAGEFLSDPAYMDELTSAAPRDWWHKNIQVVIATKVINGNSGPPRVVDRYFW